MSLLTAANLALSHIGEPVLDALTDTTPAAQTCNLHLPVILKTLLEGHHWSFATRTTPCAPLQSKDSIVVSGSLTADSNPVTFPTLLDAGTQTKTNPEFITVTRRIFTSTGLIADSYINAAVTTPPAGVSYPYFLFVIESLSVASPFPSQAAAATLIYYPSALSYSLWVTTHPFGDFDPAHVDWSAVQNDLSTGTPVFTVTRGITSTSRWLYAWHLPADCLRLLTINGTDADLPSQRFEIQGRHLLTDTPDPPTIRYITASPPAEEWPTTFLDALAYSLAARIAPILTQSDNKVQAFTTLAEVALGKARSKDARETRSAENMTPRRLAALSGLVRARYQNHTRPPY